MRKRGAIYGKGLELQGNSYAIPTRDENLRALPLVEIAEGVERFLNFAKTHPWQLFEVMPIACGRTGYKPEHVAPMFASASHNVTLPQAFELAA